MSKQPESLTGSCLCGGISYRIRGGVGNLTYCHCSMCRKAQGSAFGSYAPVSWGAFEVVNGEELIREYRSSAEVTRTFCGCCGSTLQFIRDGRGGFGIAVGTLNEDPGGRATAQIWTQNKAPWWNLHDEPPCYNTIPAESPAQTDEE